MKSFNKLLRTGVKAVKDNLPAIASGCAILGTWLTAIAAVRNTAVAMGHIEDAENKKGSKLEKMEVVQACWPDYLQTITLGALTTASQVVAYTSGKKQNLALAGLVAIGQDTMASYTKEVITAVGEDKELQIRHSMDQKKIDETIDKYQGSFPFDLVADKEYYAIDCMTGSVFVTNANRIDHAKLEIERKIYTSFEHEAYLCDLYYALNDPEHLDPNAAVAQYPNGWDADHPLRLSVTCGGWNGVPCYYLRYQVYNLQTNTPICNDFYPVSD